MAVFTLWPAMDVFFWRTTQAGYLQPSLIYLALIACVLNWKGRDSRPQVLEVALLSCGSFLAGLSFENSPVVLGAIFVVLAFRVPFKPFEWRILIPISSLFLGWLLLVTAPSTTFRREFFRSQANIEEYTPTYYLFVRLPDVVLRLLQSSWVLILFALLASALLLVLKVQIHKVFVAWTALVVNVVSLIPAPYTEPRTFMISWVLLIVLVIIALLEVSQRSVSSKFGIAVALVFSCIATATYMAPGHEAFASKMSERNHIIRSLVGEEPCAKGLEIERIDVGLPARFLNNRDDWIFTSLDQASAHYNCLLVEK
jgi:hypothetical protein